MFHPSTPMESAERISNLLSETRSNLTIDLQKAHALCSEAIALSVQGKHAGLEGEARHLQAQLQFTLGDSLKAIEEIKEAIRLRREAGDRLKVSASLNSLGIFLSDIGNYAEALDCCFQSLRIKEELNDKRGIATTLINIGSIYQRLNNPREELKMYERSLNIANEIGDARLVANNRLNLGLLYTNTGQDKLALQYLEGIEDTLLSLGDKPNAIKALNNQGMLFLRMLNYPRALERYQRCHQLATEAGNPAGMAASLNNTGEVLIKMNRPDEALPYLQQGLELATKQGLKEYIKDAHHSLTEYYKLKGDYRTALEQYETQVKLKDELLNIQNLKQLGELHLQYDLERKEREAQIHQLKNVELKDALEKLKEEKMRSDKLLLNILPEEVAEELKETGTAKAKYFEQVTVMFIDIKNFTIISQQLSPEELVSEIDLLFRTFDEIIERYGIEKIKTIGDAYMCAAGLPVPDENHAANILNAAIDIVTFMEELKHERHQQGKHYCEVRIGVHSGPVVAGIVGSSKFAYDIWGDTVNTASRMESSGEVGRINLSGDTYRLISKQFDCLHRGKIHAKNKGEIDMYFLENNKP
ncbi:MAG: adenylate/guanylate cyclase domain-containing protein [Chitinophagales bacterium]